MDTSKVGMKRKGDPGDVLNEERAPASPTDSTAGTLRAGGRRVRKKRDINSWAMSIPTNRRNILCLGMSYPNVDWVVRNFKLPKNSKPIVLFNQEPSVERAIELVRRNILNQIDGRDLARINALEADNDKLAYTVSKEQAATWYEKRHLHADFNSRNLVNQMLLKWGKTVRFHQVILDYFWSPSGSWAIKSWQRSFFNENIPNFVEHKLFNYGDLNKDTVVVKAAEQSTTKKKKKDSTYVTSDAAVVYLPFSSHCFHQVVACYEKLSKFFTISFLKKEDLDEHTLWKATNTISPSSMQVWLAKSIDQEEKYCKLDYSEIKALSDDEFATREEIVNIFNRIKEPDEVRMIKLMALRKFHPDYTSSFMPSDKPVLGVDKGGYVGLLDPSEVVLRRAPSPTEVKEAGTSTGDEPLKESNTVVPRFITQLAEILDRKNRKIIELLPDGITIHDETALETQLLPQFFTPGSLINFKNTLRKYKFSRTEKNTFTHYALAKDMSIESLLKIDKNGSVPGTSKALQDRLYDQVFGEHGKNIMLDVSNPSYKELMFYHYQKLGAKPDLGLPRQFGHEIFKKLQKKISKSGGAFLNGKGEKMDKEKASRKVMRNVYLRMNTHKDWKNYQFVDDGGMDIDDVELSDDESDQNQNQNLIQQKKKGKGKGRSKGRQVCNVKGCRKTKWGRGMCYNHAQKAGKGIPIGEYSSDDDDEIPTARPDMRTIGTQTGTSTYDDVPLVSDSSGHYTSSIASDSSSSSSARGLPKDDTTVDENSSSSGDNESDTNIQRSPIGCTPHINDVLLVAGHHSHMGNVQFCNAVSMCNTDFSVVPECFSDALKSLSPPGRFLVKSVSDGGWKEISHDLAPSIIPLIMDHHKLKSSHLYQRESLSFLSRVDQKIESKYGGPCSDAKAPERSPTSPTASLPATTVTAPTPAVVAAPIANTKEAVTNKCIAQTLQTFNIWNDQNWRNNMLAGFGVDTSKMAQDGFLLNQLTSETLNQILEQSSLSAHTLLTLVFDAEVKSLVKSHDAMV